MDKKIYLLKNMGILAISNFASKILIFLLVPLYTAVLSPAEYGNYDLAVSTATLLYPILTLNIVDAVVRFALDKDSKDKEISNIGIRYVLLSCFLFMLVLWISRYFDIEVFAELSNFYIYVCIYYSAYVLHQFLIQFAKGQERIKDLGFSGVLNTFVMIASNVFFLIVLDWGLIGFFIANIISEFAASIYLFFSIKVWKYLSFDPVDRKIQKEMLYYSIPLIATTLGWWVNSTADKYAVSIMLGVAANGFLSVSYKIPQMINALQTIFIQAWQISAVKEYGKEETKYFYGETFSAVNMLMCLACSAFIILTKLLARFLFSGDFYAAWQYVPFLLLSSVFNCASGLLGPILSAKKDSKSMMFSALGGSMINIVMNIVLIKLIGIQGATIATLFSSIVIYLIRKIAVGKHIIIDNYAGICLTWFLLLVQATIKVYIDIWYLECVILFLILLVNKKALMQYIQGLMNFLKTRRNSL